MLETNRRSISRAAEAVVQADSTNMILMFEVEIGSAGGGEHAVGADIGKQVFGLKRPRPSEGRFNAGADRIASFVCLFSGMIVLLRKLKLSRTSANATPPVT